MIKLLTTAITTSFVLVVAPTASVAKHHHHHHDHYVCAIGYHYVGDGVCRRNGDWYQGRRHEYVIMAWNTDPNQVDQSNCLMARQDSFLICQACER